MTNANKHSTKGQRLIAKLQRMASRAADSRDAFESALERAKERPDWRKVCAEARIEPDCNTGDWLC